MINIELIKKKMSHSLSGLDINNLLNGKVKIITYNDIADYTNIIDLIGEYKKLVILYESKKNYGHWVCLYMYGKTLYYFDSAGKKPEAYLDFMPEELKINCKQYHTYLIYLIYTSKISFEYNNHKLQADKKDINTCGRWVSVRLKYSEIPVDKFYQIFKNSGVPYDILVTLLTFNIG